MKIVKSFYILGLAININLANQVVNAQEYLSEIPSNSSLNSRILNLTPRIVAQNQEEEEKGGLEGLEGFGSDSGLRGVELRENLEGLNQDNGTTFETENLPEVSVEESLEILDALENTEAPQNDVGG